MKRVIWILAVAAFCVLPCRAEKKLSVEQLKDLLTSLQQAKKSDEETANALKQVELTEQLGRQAMNDLAAMGPGQKTTEQIYVLEAESAMLPLPADRLPQTPAPDAAEQTTLLNKAFKYASSVYDALPDLAATKTTLRFQDNFTVINSGGGEVSNARDESQSSAMEMHGPENNYVHYINATETPIKLEKGAEVLPSTKDSTAWGQNGFMALQAPDPSLGMVMSEAQHLTFVRWENVNGKAAAVFNYSVDKKKSRLKINICCFPQVEQAGTTHFSSAILGGLAGTRTQGNLQTHAQWHDYHATVPYHGMIFVDPATGIVVRLITEVDFKSSDYIRKQDTRIDYEPVQVGGKLIELPMKSVVQSVVVPQGDSGVGGHSLRHSFFITSYKNYAAQ